MKTSNARDSLPSKGHSRLIDWSMIVHPCCLIFWCQVKRLWKAECNLQSIGRIRAIEDHAPSLLFERLPRRPGRAKPSYSVKSWSRNPILCPNRYRSNLEHFQKAGTPRMMTPVRWFCPFRVFLGTEHVEVVSSKLFLEIISTGFKLQLVFWELW